jgi:hypothetical protein
VVDKIPTEYVSLTFCQTPDLIITRSLLNQPTKPLTHCLAPSKELNTSVNNNDNIIELKSPEESAPDLLTELLRKGAKELIRQAVNAVFTDVFLVVISIVVDKIPTEYVSLTFCQTPDLIITRSLLYQPTKPLTHCLAPSKELKPSEGHRGQYTPNQRHQGLDVEILEKRKNLYQQKRNEQPERWSGKVRNWEPEGAVELNPGFFFFLISQHLALGVADSV